MSEVERLPVRFVRQIYGIEIGSAWTRWRPAADFRFTESLVAKRSFHEAANIVGLESMR
jgi:hypothetical protein